MEFMYLYMLIFCFYACLLGIVIVNATSKDSVLIQEDDLITQYIKKKNNKLKRSKIKMSIKEYLALILILPGGLSALCYFSLPDKPLMLPLSFIGGMFIPDLIINMKIRENNKDYSSHYSRALGEMVASLNSGETFVQAIKAVSESNLMHPTIKSDFENLYAQISFGIPIQKAFMDYAVQTGNDDVKDTAIIINIMMEFGNQADEAIKQIKTGIDARLLYRKKREALMAESEIMLKFGVWVPLIVGILAYVFMPSVIASYLQSTEMTLLLIIIICMPVIGSFITHNIIKQKKDIA